MPLLSDSSQLNGTNDNGWWAIYTLHQHEKSVAKILDARGCDVFLPLYDSVRRWKDRKMKLSLPLFPCYLFVRAETGRRLDVVSTPGVCMIVAQGSRLALVAPEEIEALRRAVHGSSRVEPHPYLKCGERVRVVRGALEGVEGILTRKKNLCRLVLSVEMLARSAALEVDAEDVTPVLHGLTSRSSYAGDALYAPSQQSRANQWVTSF